MEAYPLGIYLVCCSPLLISRFGFSLSCFMDASPRRLSDVVDVPSIYVQDECFPAFAFGSAMSPLEQLDLPFSLDSVHRLFSKSSSMDVLDWREQNDVPDYLSPISLVPPLYPPTPSPSTLTLGETRNSIDPNEVCMGRLPSFLAKSQSHEERMSIELPFPVSDMNVEPSFPSEDPLPLPDRFSCSILPACPAIEKDIMPLPFPDDEEDESPFDPCEWKEEDEMESVEQLTKKTKQNHTWEETACRLQLNMSAPEMSPFSIPEKWLSAEQYMKLLNEMEQMVNSYPFYDLGCDCHQVTYHPSFIYYNPCPAIYFLRCEHLKNGKPMFGFPRIKNVSKEYTWKKQGFTTAVPKSNPLIRYITANCYLCGKGKNRNNMFAAFSGREPVLRMHAVMKVRPFQTRGNTERYQNDNYIDEGPFVLIHILKGGSHS